MKRIDDARLWIAAWEETPPSEQAYERAVDIEQVLLLPGVCVKTAAGARGVLVSVDPGEDPQVVVRCHSHYPTKCVWTCSIVEFKEKWELD